MALTAQKVENRLLAHHFFPRIAKRGDEFPPCFVSTDLTEELSNKLRAVGAPRSDGYGTIAVRATRYDLAPRNMEVLHPRAYVDLVRELRDSWSKWRHVENNYFSALRLTDHKDGRVFSMNESASAQDLLYPGGRFHAKADISNFYGSIYTHAIPWAVHGVVQAKAIQGNKTDWANRLDSRVRNSRRKETTGISIGPGTSAIIGEIILASIDSRIKKRDPLAQSNKNALRFIDDYSFVASSRDEAEAFINAVRDELACLKLSIHPTKTEILELPKPMLPRWMRELRLTRRGPISLMKLLDVLDQALEAGGIGEDGELRYALVVVEEALDSTEANDHMREAIAERLLTIGYLRPVAVGPACRVLGTLDPGETANRAESLNRILIEHVENGRTDAATWALYTLLKADVAVSSEAADAIEASGDCLALGLLSHSNWGTHYVERFLENFELQSPQDYERDEYWLLYYLCALEGKHPKSTPSTYYQELQPLIDTEAVFIDLDATNPYEPFQGRRPNDPHTPMTGGPGGLGPYAD